MSGHTKGPWSITQESIDPEWHIVTVAGGRIMANVHIEIGNAMDEANARLIVAAPDLLAAVRELMDQPTMNPLDMTPAQRAKLWSAHASARAAIEKAAPFSAWQTGERVK